MEYGQKDQSLKEENDSEASSTSSTSFPTCIPRTVELMSLIVKPAPKLPCKQLTHIKDNDSGKVV